MSEEQYTPDLVDLERHAAKWVRLRDDAMSEAEAAAADAIGVFCGRKPGDLAILHDRATALADRARAVELNCVVALDTLKTAREAESRQIEQQSLKHYAETVTRLADTRLRCRQTSIQRATRRKSTRPRQRTPHVVDIATRRVQPVRDNGLPDGLTVSILDEGYAPVSHRLSRDIALEAIALELRTPWKSSLSRRYEGYERQESA